jgi:hypothetical protein
MGAWDRLIIRYSKNNDIFEMISVLRWGCSLDDFEIAQRSVFLTHLSQRKEIRETIQVPMFPLSLPLPIFNCHFYNIFLWILCTKPQRPKGDRMAVLKRQSESRSVNRNSGQRSIVEQSRHWYPCSHTHLGDSPSTFRLEVQPRAPSHRGSWEGRRRLK